MNMVTYKKTAKLIQQKIKIDWQPFQKGGTNLLSQPLNLNDANNLMDNLINIFGNNIKNCFSIQSSADNPQLFILFVDLTQVDYGIIKKSATNAYTTGATQELLKDHLPPEMGMKIGSFLDRRAGHAVGQAHPRAHKVGREEAELDQDRNDRALKKRR